jgi:lysophospholipase L1-like esterase
MQATHGFAVSFRSRTRLVGCAMAIVLALSALAFASTASAKTGSKPDYLALGDSLAFGYSQQLFNENEKLGEPPTAFEHGYVNDYFATFKNMGSLTNDGCPGETTDSMIGNGPLGTAMARSLGTTGESPCAYHKAGLRLHHEYGGTKSQLESALETVAAGAAMGKPVKTLTLNIGANDELRTVHKCEKEAEPAEKAAYEKAYIETLQKGGTTAEAEAAGKKAAAEAGKAYVKKCIEEHAAELFKHILTNIAGSLYVIRNGGSFGGVNYTEKIVVQGGYDPFGAVFTPKVELLEGSNALAAALNFEEAKVVQNFGACYANPQPTFNPQNNEEPTRLQKFTNMANFTEFEGKKNGPDIHPTPLGYQELANIMVANCG